MFKRECSRLWCPFPRGQWSCLATRDRDHLRPEEAAFRGRRLRRTTHSRGKERKAHTVTRMHVTRLYTRSHQFLFLFPACTRSLTSRTRFTVHAVAKVAGGDGRRRRGALRRERPLRIAHAGDPFLSVSTRKSSSPLPFPPVSLSHLSRLSGRRRHCYREEGVR